MPDDDTLNPNAVAYLAMLQALEEGDADTFAVLQGMDEDDVAEFLEGENAGEEMTEEAFAAEFASGRKEGERWQGPSGRWFTIKNGRAVPAKASAGASPDAPTTSAPKPPEAPVAPPVTPAPKPVPKTAPESAPSGRIPKGTRPELSPDESRAVSLYTGFDYKPLNAALRDTGKPPPDKVAAHEAMQSAFKKAKAFRPPTNVNRSLYLDDPVAQKFAQMAVAAKDSGGVVTVPGYVSTTRNDFAGDLFRHGNVQLSINAVHGIDAEPYSTSKGEQELILNHNSKFVVRSVENRGGTWHVELDQLPPSRRVKGATELNVPGAPPNPADDVESLDLPDFPEMHADAVGKPNPDKFVGGADEGAAWIAAMGRTEPAGEEDAGDAEEFADAPNGPHPDAELILWAIADAAERGDTDALADLEELAGDPELMEENMSLMADVATFAAAGRKEGEVWKGPSGRYFTIKKGRAVPAKGPGGAEAPGAKPAGGKPAPAAPKAPKPPTKAAQKQDATAKKKATAADAHAAATKALADPKSLTADELATVAQHFASPTAMTAPQLKAFAKQVKAKVTGTKAELGKRLLEHITNTREPKPAETPKTAAPAATPHGKARAALDAMGLPHGHLTDEQAAGLHDQIKALHAKTEPAKAPEPAKEKAPEKAPEKPPANKAGSHEGAATLVNTIPGGVMDPKELLAALPPMSGEQFSAGLEKLAAGGKIRLSRDADEEVLRQTGVTVGGTTFGSIARRPGVVVTADDMRAAFPASPKKATPPTPAPTEKVAPVAEKPPVPQETPTPPTPLTTPKLATVPSSSKAAVPPGHTVAHDFGGGVVTTKDPKTGEMVTRFPPGMPEKAADKLHKAIAEAVYFAAQDGGGYAPVSQIAAEVSGQTGASPMEVGAAITAMQKSRALNATTMLEGKHIQDIDAGKESPLTLPGSKSLADGFVWTERGPLVYVQTPRAGMSAADISAEYQKNKPKT